MASKKKGTPSNGETTAKDQVPPEEFVKTWQECANMDEAREKLGDGASSRAARYRKAGVNLKTMPGALGRKLDVKALNAIIAQG